MSNIYAKGNRFTLNGRTFIPIGHNMPVERFIGMSTVQLDRYFKRMRANRENLIRIIIDTPECIEPRIGDFSSFKKFFIPFLQSAKEHGVYILPVLFFPNWLTWHDHPYCNANGGPLTLFTDIFNSSVGRKLVRDRIIAVIDMVDDESAIFAWELCNELQFEQNEWIEEMVSLAGSISPKMRSVSISIVNTGDSSWAQWRSSHLDYISFHSYGRDPLLTLQLKNCMGDNSQEILRSRVENVGRIVDTVKRKMKFRDIPFMDTEVPRLPEGFFQRWLVNSKLKFTLQSKLYENFLHVGNEFMLNEAAGPGLPWTISPRMQPYQKRLAEAWS